ncbi:hypothetical protein F5Y11DRAFT_316731 [Daldinia sp. FL1419]|nr:hypothetical protein F5Y11DRAFT_316731 [Daldinia sp. FL1419]
MIYLYNLSIKGYSKPLSNNPSSITMDYLWASKILYDPVFPSAVIRPIQPYGDRSAKHKRPTAINLSSLTKPASPDKLLDEPWMSYSQDQISAARMKVVRSSILKAPPSPSDDGQHPSAQVRGSTQNINYQDNERDLDFKSTFSPNYRGAIINRNKSEDIPESENCAVWMDQLPAGIDYPTLLSQLRGTGKIYAIFISPPEENRHPGCAAKVVFWRRGGVQRILQKSRDGKIKFGDQVPTVRMNRIKRSAQPISNRSRVIVMRGPSAIVNLNDILLFLNQRCYFDLESVEVYQINTILSAMRWTFASFRNQAETAMDKLEKELGGEIECFWGEDPCDG